MAISKVGKVYTWGYNGNGLLGRPKSEFEYLPFEIGNPDDPFIGKYPELAI